MWAKGDLVLEIFMKTLIFDIQAVNFMPIAKWVAFLIFRVLMMAIEIM